MNPAMILYDLDGTLVDTRQDIVNAATHMLAHFGKPPVSAETIHAYVGRGMPNLVRDCLQTQDESVVDQGMQIYRKFYGEHLMDHSRLYPKTVDLLRYFENRPQAVVTNKPTPFSDDLLRGLKIHDRFTRVVSGNSGYPKKPDPTSVLEVVREAGINPQDTVFVGDSPVDVITGKSAGMFTVALAQGFVPKPLLVDSQPDVLLDSLEEFWQLVSRENW